MAIPDYQTLMLPLLKQAALGEVRVLEAEKQLGNEFGLTQEERSQFIPSGKQRVMHNRVHWAKFYMMKAGLLSFPKRGAFIATDAGRALLAQNLSKIDVNVLKKYPSFQEFYHGDGSETDASVGTVISPGPIIQKSTPEEQIDSAYRTFKSALRTTLLERILQNSSDFFEMLIVELLLKMGYGDSQRDAGTRLGKSGDGGVDGVIKQDRLGLDRVYLQAKRYAEGNVVGRPEVQKFLGSLVGIGATKGVFVTTSKFSNEAIEFAKHLSQRIILIDGQELTELMIQHGVGVRLNRSIEFKEIDENFFDEDD